MKFFICLLFVGLAAQAFAEDIAENQNEEAVADLERFRKSAGSPPSHPPPPSHASPKSAGYPAPSYAPAPAYAPAPSYAPAPAYPAKPSYAPAPAYAPAPSYGHAAPAYGHAVTYSYQSPVPTMPCSKNIVVGCQSSVQPVPCSAPSYAAPSYGASY